MRTEVRGQMTRGMFYAMYVLILLAALPLALSSQATVFIDNGMPDHVAADTAQLQRLNQYLLWRGFELEPSSSSATIQTKFGRRILFYYLTAARRPAYNGASVYDLPIEIHQFATAEEARSFSPYSTLLALDPVDLSGPGQLDQYIALHTQTYWNGNMVLFMQVPPDGRLEPEDFALAGTVKERFIRDFLDFSDAMYEGERRVSGALDKIARALDAEGAEGKALLREVLDEYDGVDYASRLSPQQWAVFDRMLGEMIAEWEAGITLAREIRGRDYDRARWLPPAASDLATLAEYADSSAFLAFRRTLEVSAIDRMYRMDSAEVTPSNEELELIRDALKAEMDSGQLRELWRLRNWRPAFGLDDVRVYGMLAGAVVYPTDVPSAGSPPSASDTIAFVGQIPIGRLFRSSSSSLPEPTPRESFAVYMRKSEGRWVMRRIVPLNDAGWAHRTPR